MNNKQNILQKLKGWTKFSRSRKNRVNTDYVAPVVINSNQLLPACRKSSTNVLKSVQKNKAKLSKKKDFSLLTQNAQFNESFDKDNLKRNNIGDSKVRSQRKQINKKRIDLNKVLLNNKESNKTSKFNANYLHKIQDTSLNHVMIYPMETDDKNVMEPVDKNSNTSLTPLNDLSLTSINCNLLVDDKVRGDAIYALCAKEETLSMMNLFQKETSFINYRKEVIKRFEKLKNRRPILKASKRKNWKFQSNPSNLNNHSDNEFNVILDNTLEKFPSERCLDVSMLLEGKKTNLRNNKNKLKADDELLSSCSDSTQCVESNHPKKKKKNSPHT